MNPPNDRTDFATPEDVIYNEDCITGMARLPEGFVDLVITDPPFGIDFKAKQSYYNRTSDNVLEGYGEVSQSEYSLFTLTWIREMQRVLKPSGSAFIFSGWNNLRDVLNAIEFLGLKTINHVIWKYQFGVITKRKFVTSHYHCLYVAKDDRFRSFHIDSRYRQSDRTDDDRSARYRDLEDVWVINREYWRGDTKTPTKLPFELVKKILDYASRPGELVLDPFLGSGQVAVVAKMLDRRYLGFEIVEEYYQFARERLQSGSYRISIDQRDGELFE